jgi:hypothetical protein
MTDTGKKARKAYGNRYACKKRKRHPKGDGKVFASHKSVRDMRKG